MREKRGTWRLPSNEAEARHRSKRSVTDQLRHRQTSDPHPISEADTDRGAGEITPRETADASTAHGARETGSVTSPTEAARDVFMPSIPAREPPELGTTSGTCVRKMEPIRAANLAEGVSRETHGEPESSRRSLRSFVSAHSYRSTEDGTSAEQDGYPFTEGVDSMGSDDLEVFHDAVSFFPDDAGDRTIGIKPP